MLGFVWQKMRSKTWMIACLLIGNLLFVAVAASCPLYSHGILQRTLTRQLGDAAAELECYPGTVQLQNHYSNSVENRFQRLEQAAELAADLERRMDTPMLETVCQFSKGSVQIVRATEEEQRSRQVRLMSRTGLEDHIRLTHGEFYRAGAEDHVIDVIVSQPTFVAQGFRLGAEIPFVSIRDAEGQAYSIRVCGVFEPENREDPYWSEDPTAWENVLLMDEQSFRQAIANPAYCVETFQVDWYLLTDAGQIREDRAAALLREIADAQQEAAALGGTLTAAFQPVLESFVPETAKLKTTMWVLQVPIFVLLTAFLFMVSRQMLDLEQNEISVFRSRGASKGQLLLLYLLQSLLIAAAGLCGGVALGVGICRVLGASNAFLEFVRRAALPIRLDGQVWLFAGAAALFSVGTMVLPVFGFAGADIVETKRSRSARPKRSWWKLCGLDVLCLAVSVYGYFQFRRQEEQLVRSVQEGASLDPLLYLCASLFMVGAALLFLRLYPLLVQLIFRLGKRRWPPSLYASFRQIGRSRGNQGFLIVFLVLTVALGLFSAQAARSINANAERQLRYEAGADVVVQEQWSRVSTRNGDGTERISYAEPDFSRYETIPGVQSATRVLVCENGRVSGGETAPEQVTVMGIHTKQFGETAWFETDLLPTHWYHYLNAMAQRPDGVLLSSDFRDRHGYALGDTVRYADDRGVFTQGTVCGFVDYWPGYVPTVREVKNGAVQETARSLIVANLAELQRAWGVTPYQIWMRMDGSTRPLYDFAAQQGIRYETFRDVSADLIALKNDPVFQGTNGVLTVGFLVVVLLCAVGFLIDWMLSIAARALQFGIFRAMGMTMREVLGMLAWEQLFLSGLSAAAGVGVGILTGKLFVPLIQMGYFSTDQVLPLQIIRDTGDDLRLGIILGVIMVGCMVILGIQISRMRIAQTLKLGED